MTPPGAPADSAYRPPPRLDAGETILRKYFSDMEASRKVARVYSTLALIPALCFIALGVVLLILTAVARVASPAGAAVLGIGILVGVIPRISEWTSRPRDRELPDVVYLTSQRVIVDEGLAWESTKAIPLALVTDAILWQSWVMVRAGVAWVYLMPLGATRVEVVVEGELEPAPGVIEIQNLTMSDAQDLRTEVLRLAQSRTVATSFSPNSGARPAG
jgi:hypothetical protein